MRAIVIGAGLAGLTAARGLAASGHDVTVVEKDASVGGRLAGAELAGAHFDTGAQFFTVRTDAFAAVVHGWRAGGLVHEWCRGFGTEDGYPRYTATGGMAKLAAHLAAGLDVRLGAMAFAVRAAAGRWQVGMADGGALEAEALVLACPVPQSASLLVTSGLTVPEELRTLEYDRTIAVCVALDGAPAVPAPGGLQHPEGVFSFVADNVAKGVSTAPGLTLHADAAWSLEHWDVERTELARRLVAAAAPWIAGRGVVATRVRRWRFATPARVWPAPTLVVSENPPVVLAGDAFAGPRVEGAFTSGRAAAAALA